MNKQNLQDFVMNLRKQSEYGKNRFDPALANLLFKSQAEVDADIATVIEEFVNKRGRQPTDEELAAAYVILEEKREKLKDKDMNSYFKARNVDLQYEEEKRQDDAQNQDLFILTVNGDGDRLVDREEQERSLQDRQRAIAERTLRVLEAMEKAADAVQKGEKIPEMDLSYLKDLTPKEFAKQMKVFKDFGLETVVIGEDGQVRESPEREVTLETITKEDLEDGSIAFGVSLEKMQTKEWRDMARMAKESCKRQGIESEYEPEFEPEVEYMADPTAGNKAPRNVEDDELSL